MFSIFVGYTDNLQDFTVRVGNSSNIDYHFDICAFHPGYIPAAGRAVLPCDGIKVARYLSIVNSKKHTFYYYFYMCEVVIIGAVAAGKCNMGIPVIAVL